MENFFRESGVKWLWERIKTLLSAKQDKLVSGENIKTINGTSLLGSGDVSIEGGGDFDSSGTYPNLTAGKATKLATARTISLSGGAAGSVSFDGSANRTLNVGSLYDTAFQYGTIPNGNATGLTLIDATEGKFVVNRLAFKRPEDILIEHSNDGGTTWDITNVTDESKVKLVSGLGSSFYLGNKSTGQTNQDKLRITIYSSIGSTKLYSSWKRLYIYLSTSGAYVNGVNALWCTYEYSLIGSPDTWVSKGDYQVAGWGGWNKLPAAVNNFGLKTNVASSPYALRLTFWFEGHAGGYENKTAANIQKIEMRGDTVYANYSGCKLPETGHLYDYDWQKNATFPANVTATKHITQGGTNQQVVLGNGNLKAISELSPITDADADILLDNHIHNINVKTNGNNVNISVIESSKNGNNWETEDNDIPIPLATPTSAGVMSKEDKAKLDGNISIEPDSGMPDFIGDFEYSDVDYEAIIDLTTVDWINWVEGGLFMMNAEETWEEDNGDTSYHQCVVTFIYRSNGCIPISIVNTNKMTAKMSGMVITINLTEGTGEIRFKQIKLI